MIFNNRHVGSNNRNRHVGQFVKKPTCRLKRETVMSVNSLNNRHVGF
ncbi:hypothetical protein Patl1_28955 [Pistacia atlantica]|uniref:Uncharacterized protein n=1 Tax=Pistacia atlantica TaxID=434234 RepID=A0ACC1BGS2_9ROSI|nr:hypothetical protein Patl1_28955 [Pistacia atlantica]